MANEPVRITVQGVLEDLENGYTRTTSDKHYMGEGKSIEEKYGLNKTQVGQLFKHDKLKGRKTKVQSTPAFILIDEDDIAVDTTTESVVETTDNTITSTEESEKDTKGIDEINETPEAKEVVTESDEWLQDTENEESTENTVEETFTAEETTQETDTPSWLG